MPIKSFKNKIISWDEYENKFFEIKNNNNIEMSDLYYIEKQKESLLQNTILFAQGKLCNNVLLWGARGTGKSSLVLAVFNKVIINYEISLLEIKKNQIRYLSSILRKLSNTKTRYIIFCDDFSFSSKSEDFIIFKNILDGTVSKDTNFIYFVTSNFRSIIKNDNNSEETNIINQQEVIDDETALSDRFGMWLGFQKFNEEQYLSIIKKYYEKFNLTYNLSFIEKKAIQWSLNRGSKSGREAFHFVKSLVNNKL